jgi:dipeptidyl aminopeptidase/acylaminoacyl peptidase
MKNKMIIAIILILTTISLAQSQRPITADDLWSMKRVSSVTVSPDGNTIAFVLRVYDMDANSGQSDIWLINSDGSNLRVLKNSEGNETQPEFLNDGKTISYRYKSQIWTCDYEGNNTKQITNFYSGASGVRWSTDGEKLLFTSYVYPECMTQECNESKDKQIAESKITAKVFDELLYRHWDDWRGPKRSHLFLYDLKNDKYTDLSLSSKYDVPAFALGSSNDYNFSPDGNQVVFTMNKSDFLATSTDNDVFIMNLSDIKDKYITPYTKISLSKGNDNQPVYSPDGKYIAFRSMARSGFEADRQVLKIYDRLANEVLDISDAYDISIGSFIWSNDSKFIYYTAANEVYNSIYSINIDSKENELLMKEVFVSSLNISPDDNTLYFANEKTTMPAEVFAFDINNKELTQLTHLNKELLAELDMNDIELFWSDGAGGTPVQSILVKPPKFDPDKKYPMIFMIHGGPQGHTSDKFHYRWNLQMFASKGYVVVAPNPRGSTGFGQKFTDEITQDWNGKVFIDLMNAFDYAVDTYRFIDAKNAFACGASYGGYMINWIEGHNDEGRFKALFTHAGVYNLESMYGSTEELWFPEWEFGGAPWENEELYKSMSPSSYVENFKTPMLIVHGAKDFRVPESQAFELFTALQKMNVESKFVYFPDENHFILQPQNARFWWKTVFDWFDKFYVRY